MGHGQHVEAEHDFHHHSEDGVRDAAAVRVHESFVPCHGLPVGDATHAHVLGFHIVNSCDPKIRKEKTCKNHQRLAILCRVFMILMAIASHHCLGDFVGPGCPTSWLLPSVCYVHDGPHVVPGARDAHGAPGAHGVHGAHGVRGAQHLVTGHHRSIPSLSDLRSLRPHLGTFQLPTKTRCIAPPPWPASA